MRKRKQTANIVFDGLWLIRFFEMRPLFAKLSGRSGCALGRTCHYDFGLRMVGPHPPGQREPIKRPRNIDGTENYVNPNAAAIKHKQRFIARRRLNDAVSALTKVSRNRHPHEHGTFDDENRRKSFLFGSLFNHSPLTIVGMALFRLGKQLSNALDQLDETHRFRKTGIEFDRASSTNFRRNENDFDRRELTACPVSQRYTIDIARHANIGQQQADVVDARQQRYRLIPAGGFDNVVSGISKLLRQMQPDKNFVFHDQYRTLCQDLALSCRRRFDFVSPFPHATLNGSGPY